MDVFRPDPTFRQTWRSLYPEDRAELVAFWIICFVIAASILCMAALVGLFIAWIASRQVGILSALMVLGIAATGLYRS
jgi:hypothetical protein